MVVLEIISLVIILFLFYTVHRILSNDHKRWILMLQESQKIWLEQTQKEHSNGTQ